jgi:hypothetical protein
VKWARTLGSYCRVAASAPRGGAYNVAYGKAGRAAAAIGMRIFPPHTRAPRSGAYKTEKRARHQRRALFIHF